MRQILVEIVIPQLAEKGGLDKIINEYADLFLEKNDMELRVVQLVDTGFVWWSSHYTVRSLCQVHDNPSFRDTAEAYANYLEGLERKPDIILATGWPVTITIVREALRRTKSAIPLVAYPHMTFREGEDKGVGGLICLNDADVIFAISRQIESEIKNSGVSIKAVRVDNGICFPKQCYRAGKVKEKKLLYVGRLVKGKNLAVIFRAIAMAKDVWSLKVVGQGELEETVEQARANGVMDRVEFCGFLEKPYEYADDVMFCVIASEYEGFCLVIPEALSCGIPVISTPVGCATEMIRPGENGYLFNVNDPEMLAQILNLIAEGKLPVPDDSACRESVQKYELKNAFEVLYRALLDIYQEYAKA